MKDSDYLKNQIDFLKDKFDIVLKNKWQEKKMYDEIIHWIQENSSGSVYFFADRLWFSEEEDASAFLLRWSENE